MNIIEDKREIIACALHDGGQLDEPCTCAEILIRKNKKMSMVQGLDFDELRDYALKLEDENKRLFAIKTGYEDQVRVRVEAQAENKQLRERIIELEDKYTEMCEGRLGDLL